jgi:hypothetical protein
MRAVIGGVQLTPTWLGIACVTIVGQPIRPARRLAY